MSTLRVHDSPAFLAAAEWWQLLARRRYTPPPRYEEVVTTLEPAPFADMFSEVQDFLGEVREHAATASLLLLLQ